MSARLSPWDRIRLRVAAWLALGAGLVHSVGRRPGEAEEAYRLALMHHLGSKLARLMLGDSLENQGQWEEAVEVYDGMIRRDSSDENAHYDRAHCLLELGRAREAARDCRRAIELYLKHFAAYVVLGQAESVLGRHEEAVAALERALELRPCDQDAAELLRRLRPGT